MSLCKSLSIKMSGVGAFDMGPAGKVSPLIKTARWGLLLTGIWWGHKRYQINKAREEEIRAYNLKMKPVWDAEKAVESAKANREQLLYLAKETGTRIPPNF